MGKKKRRYIKKEKVRASELERTTQPVHEELTPYLQKRVQILWDHGVGQLWADTFEKWVYGFLCEQHPDREITVWEAIAQAFDTFTKNRARTKEHLKLVVGASMGAKPSSSLPNKVKQELQVAWTQAWEASGGEGRDERFLDQIEREIDEAN